MTLRVAIVGFGKIARDQHVPAIAGTAGVTLAAVASRNASLPDVPHFATLDDLLRDGPEIDAVALCTPPQVRRAQAVTALNAGKHVMLEKPPGVTVSELDPLMARAAQARRTLFATWHSRHAAAIEPARAWLASRRIRSVTINWKEDVRVWHPGQDWIWQAGGFGVFDPGINALSVLTEVLPKDVCVEKATLEFPENQQSPIAALLGMRTEDGVAIEAEFDFRQKGEQSWDIELTTTTGRLKLSNGGATLAIDGKTVTSDAGLAGEYPRLYQRFAKLCATGKSEVDWRPFQLVADAFLVGERRTVAAHQV